MIGIIFTYMVQFSNYALSKVKKKKKKENNKLKFHNLVFNFEKG